MCACQQHQPAAVPRRAVVRVYSQPPACARTSPGRRPNVVFIRADDRAAIWLLRETHYRRRCSMRLRQGSGSPVTMQRRLCTPSRCVHHGALSPTPSRRPQEPLKSISPRMSGSRLTIRRSASLLRPMGANALVGRVAPGVEGWVRPNRHRFDQFFGVSIGATDYFTPRRRRPGPRAFREWRISFRTWPRQRTRLFDRLALGQAVGIVSSRRQRPFFLSLHYGSAFTHKEGPADGRAPHDPRQARWWRAGP